MRRRALAAVGLLVVGGGCSSGDDDGTATTTGGSASAVSASVTSVDGGSDPARQALDDVVRWLADPATADPARFADVFLQQVPIEQVRQVMSQLGAGAWTAVGVESIAPGAVAATLEGPGPALVVQLQVDAEGRIAELLFLPPSSRTSPPISPDWSSGSRRRRRSPASCTPTWRPDGSCAPVAELAPTAMLPIGSTFKLYVLGAVAAMIESGEIGWDDPVQIRDELDSLPSGETQDEPAGSNLSVRELATRMISVSDNTTTDHLFDLVGRDRVEQALVTLGHSNPAATTPMLTTREMFVIKTNPDLLARYQSADGAARRALLEGEVAAAPLPAVTDFPDRPPR